MASHAVVVVGGGPTGMMLAAELAIAKVDVAVVERRATQELAGSRAGGLHARTIEELDQRGIAERFLSEGQTMKAAGFALIPLDIADFPSRHAYVLALTQNRIERILATWVAELGVPTYRGREVCGFTQHDAGVDVALSDGSGLRAQFLVGCDGGRSFVRKHAGIAFPGWDASVSFLIAECETKEEPAWGARPDARGINGLAPIDGGRRMRAVLCEPEVRRGDAPTEDELRAALVGAYGTDFGFFGVTWLSRFTDTARQAARYRSGRVLLAGDAAHVHAPTGGQGLNLGVQDAINLGWKLARVVRGDLPVSRLDSYQAERHPVAARVLENTLAQIALMRGDDRTKALHGKVSELLRLEEPRQRYGAMMSGLDVRHHRGDGHPLLGRRMPDLELDLPDGSRRLFTFLHDAQPLLVVLDARDVIPSGPRMSSVKRVDARYAGPWQLPVVGSVRPPSSVLVRPDGYVAWVGEGSDEGLEAALSTWVRAS